MFKHLGKNSGMVDGRVDSLIKTHHTALDLINTTAKDLNDLRFDFEKFREESTIDRTLDKIGPLDTPPAVVNHITDHHHTYIERISDEEQVRIENAMHLSQRAAQTSDSAWSIAEECQLRLEEIEDQMDILAAESTMERARYSNDLSRVQEEFSKQLTRVCWAFGVTISTVTGVAIIVWLCNTL